MEVKWVVTTQAQLEKARSSQDALGQGCPMGSSHYASILSILWEGNLQLTASLFQPSALSPAVVLEAWNP